MTIEHVSAHHVLQMTFVMSVFSPKFSHRIIKLVSIVINHANHAAQTTCVKSVSTLEKSPKIKVNVFHTSLRHLLRNE